MSSTSTELKAEILRLTRQYSALVHAAHRPADDAAHGHWALGQPIPYAGRVFDEDEVKKFVRSYEASLDPSLGGGPRGPRSRKK
jgi:CDP-6-deoxy-D-xylo-4-hexulose-3-dehydrase